MKKHIITLLTLCLICITANARGYRPSGYMGFVEDATVTDFSTVFGGITTTHGYQMDPNLFVGGGIGVIVNYENTDFVGVPLYADARYNFMGTRKVTPFAEARVGYCFADMEGFYASPSAGVDIALTEKFGLQFALGYEHYGIKTSAGIFKNVTTSLDALVLRAGIRF